MHECVERVVEGVHEVGVVDWRLGPWVINDSVLLVLYRQRCRLSICGYIETAVLSSFISLDNYFQVQFVKIQFKPVNLEAKLLSL